jgi:hypothetical protein
MASIYTNLRTERQYRAATGLSEEKFNQLFEQFKHFYVPKKAIPPAHLNPYFKMPERHSFSFSFITKPIRPYRYSAYSSGVQIKPHLSIWNTSNPS